MEELRTWSGKFFGYRDGDDLWTHTGLHVAQFEGGYLYGPDGSYLGEIVSGRLIRSPAGPGNRGLNFVRKPIRSGLPNLGDEPSFPEINPYEDFPSPENFGK
jgi:hypothetical protein